MGNVSGQVSWRCLLYDVYLGVGTNLRMIGFMHIETWLKAMICTHCDFKSDIHTCHCSCLGAQFLRVYLMYSKV